MHLGTDFEDGRLLLGIPDVSKVMLTFEGTLYALHRHQTTTA